MSTKQEIKSLKELCDKYIAKAEEQGAVTSMFFGSFVDLIMKRLEALEEKVYKEDSEV